MINSLKILFHNDDTYPLSKEDNVWFHISRTGLASRDCLLQNMLLHLIVVIRLPTVDALLGGKATMSLDDLVIRNTCTSLKGVDILCETCVEERLLSK